MKRTLFVTLALCGWLGGMAPVAAEVPHLIRYQGYVTDDQGAPLEGSYTLSFRIYDAETGGTLLWSETQAGVPLQEGNFSVLLGSVTPLDLTFASPTWLEVKVASDPPLSPRQRITSVPLAYRAEQLDGPLHIVGERVGIGTTSPSQTLDVIGTTTISENVGIGTTTPNASLDISNGTLKVTGVAAGWSADYATGGVATANEATGDTVASYAFDDDIGWTWACKPSTTPDWIQYDLGAGGEQAISMVRMYWNNNGGNGTFPRDFTIQGSLDGAMWTTLHTVTSAAFTNDTWHDFPFDNTTPYRYFRVHITAWNNPSQIYGIIREIELLKRGSGVALVTTANGHVGIGTSDPTNILTIRQSSLTDPIADSWTVYPSDRQHKVILRTIPSQDAGYLERVRALPLYEWKRAPLVSDAEAQAALGAAHPTPQALATKKHELARVKATLPKFATTRVGLLIDDPQVPPEVLIFRPDGTKAGIDLLGYLGYLHAALQEAALKIAELEVRLNASKTR